ncbi:MAG TPA: CPBP family intramembrane glutamic endopeptidase [Terracidiphilus sp.]|jgi:membrane protease YdiL (CAAX protease family)
MVISPPFSLFLQSILAFLIVVVGPLVSCFYEGPLLRNNPTSRQKIAFYRYILLELWPLTVLAVGIMGAGGLLRAPVAPGPALPVWLHWFLGGLVAGFFVLGFMPIFQSLRGEKYRARYERAFRRSLAQAPGLLPETSQERRWFAAISITAGVCEEVLCRGFMIGFLMRMPGGLHLPISVALVLSAVVFGLNHIYQGKTGLISTTLSGLAFGGLFLLTGNLLLPMLLHAAADLQGLFILRPSKPAEVPA